MLQKYNIICKTKNAFLFQQGCSVTKYQMGIMLHDVIILCPPLSKKLYLNSFPSNDTGTFKFKKYLAAESKNKALNARLILAFHLFWILLEETKVCKILLQLRRCYLHLNLAQRLPVPGHFRKSRNSLLSGEIKFIGLWNDRDFLEKCEQQVGLMTIIIWNHPSSLSSIIYLTNSQFLTGRKVTQSEEKGRKGKKRQEKPIRLVHQPNHLPKLDNQKTRGNRIWISRNEEINVGWL